MVSENFYWFIGSLIIIIALFINATDVVSITGFIITLFLMVVALVKQSNRNKGLRRVFG